MAREEINMDEFLCFKGKSQEEDNFFNRERTLKLLELYKSYKNKVGTFEVKSMKKLWELVTRDISNEYRITLPANKCENRFKVLERNYKKIIDNNNKTGRGRKVFEFEKEMDEIFEKRRNVKPVLLLSSQQNIRQLKATLEDNEDIPIEISIPECEVVPSCSQTPQQLGFEEEQNTCQAAVNANVTTTKIEPQKSKSLKRTRVASPAYQKRNDILLDIKNDLKTFYDKRDEREAEKIAISKRKLEERQKRTKIAQEYLEFLKKKSNDGASEPEN